MDSHWQRHDIFDPFGRIDGYTMVSPELRPGDAARCFFTTIREQADDLAGLPQRRR